MLRNYLVVAWRNLLKDKLYTLINVLGLAVGIGCCLVISLYVRYELSYDQFHENKDRIYRLIRGDAITAAGYATHLKQEFPEVLAAVRLDMYRGVGVLKHGGKRLDTSGFIYADSSFFGVFTFPLVDGDPRTVLTEPFSLVLTETAARNAFGGEDPLGKTVASYGNTFQVTGVAQDPPPNSHIQFQYVASFVSLEKLQGAGALEDYVNYNYYTYLLLPEGYPPAELEGKLPAFEERRKREQSPPRFWLQPLADIYLNTGSRFDFGPKGNGPYLYVFSAVGFLVLLIACINFMNLTTARSARRAREVGLRKTLGAVRRQLIGQFLGESVLLSCVALILGVALMELLMPLFENLIDKHVAIGHAGNLGLVAGLLGIGLFVGVTAGSYPAFYLSAFQPTDVLTGRSKAGRRSVHLRRVLLVGQFGITVILMVCTLTVSRQFHFMKSQPLGFKEHQVLFMWVDATLRQRYDALKQEVLGNRHVLDLTLSSVPGYIGMMQGYNWPGKGEEREASSFYSMLVDPDCLATLGLQVVEGRNLSWDIGSDRTEGYLLNETAVRQLGWQDPVGREFRVWDREPGRVVGVVRDFHFKSLRDRIEPLVMYMRPDWTYSIIAQISSQDIPGTLEFLRRKWEPLSPEVLFNYAFLDEDFDRFYKAEEGLGTILGAFFLLAMSVACLGLLGLAAYNSEQRTKEIGVRKVLGASVRSIVVLLSKEFTYLVLAANLIAWPIAWYAMHRWLEGFAYRVELGPGVFLLGGLLALGIAWLTVSWQALRAALANPVEALRYE